MKKKRLVFIGIGTNLGSRMDNIQKAYAAMETEAGHIRSRSSVYLSPPWGFEATQDFYNSVIELETALEAVALMEALKRIETAMGRIKTKEKGYESRIIDLDILDFDKEVLMSDNLQLPHPNLHRRGFVLVPLREISPLWVHPVSGKNVNELLNALDPAETPVKLNDTNI